ncbi:MAG: PKD domain-containing protein, partial [Saprospiraceae bacterium]
YTAEGTYVITLVVTDNDGATDQISKEVTVPSEPPVAVIDANANALVVNVDASNSSDSDGAIVSYAWDFGDGTTASSVTAVHTYALAGTYTISLTVTDNQGLTATASTLVIAEDSQCNLTTGALQIIGPDVTCISGEQLTVALRFTRSPKAPKKYQVAFVISQDRDMKIVQVVKQKALTVNAPGLYRIHTLVYNSATLDLDNLVALNSTTVAELNALLVPGGGISCAALDLNGIVLVVNDCRTTSNITAYPNPATESLTVALPELKGVQQIAIELFHINGTLAKRWILDGYSTQTNLNLNSLDQGLYRMRILYDQQLIQEMTIVKVK